MRAIPPAPSRGLRSLDQYGRLVRSALLVVGVFLAGVAGYAVIGYPEHDIVDAVYMTMITLTTVGYHEVIDLSDSPLGRLFTVLLLLGGVGAFVNFFSNLTALFVEGSVQQLLWRRRMDRAIDRMSGHVVVCGGGHTGEHIVEELLATRRPFVLIDDRKARVDELAVQFETEFPAVIGDATEDAVLLEAGVDRAAQLVACVSSDKDNLLVTLSARILNPAVRIVARCVEEKVQHKLRKAGADGVVVVNRIGGLRLVSEAVRPVSVSYLDMMLREGSDLRVESTVVAAGSTLADQTVAALRTELEGLSVLALRRGEEWAFAPRDDAPLRDATIVYVAGPEARHAVEELARGR